MVPMLANAPFTQNRDPTTTIAIVTFYLARTTRSRSFLCTRYLRLHQTLINCDQLTQVIGTFTTTARIDLIGLITIAMESYQVTSPPAIS